MVVAMSLRDQSFKFFILYEIHCVGVEATADAGVCKNFLENLLAVVAFSMDLTGLDQRDAAIKTGQR